MLIRSILAIILIQLSACGEVSTISLPQTGCDTGSALIGVHDGYLSRLCGCSESAGATASHGETLTCTVSAGTSIHFHYLSIKQKHQIVSSGSPSFVDSAVSDPEQGQKVTAHGISLNTTGTYTFQDEFDSTLSGQIIVQ